jgi:hypothetical protein
MIRWSGNCIIEEESGSPSVKTDHAHIAARRTHKGELGNAAGGSHMVCCNESEQPRAYERRAAQQNSVFFTTVQQHACKGGLAWCAKPTVLIADTPSCL